jgi:sterol desaturase/sphingolipid hydroxylase (fatty acid hydroxylase superfamily)
MLAVPAFHAIVAITLTVDALLLGFLIWAFHSKTLGKYRMREITKVKVSPRRFWITVIGNGIFSMVLTVAMIYGLADVVLHAGSAPVWLMVAQGVAILVVYDFTYYGLHRLMHVKPVMRLVHGVHHRARYPSALESLYLSPIELFLGLAFLMGSTYVVSLFGPVHYLAFGAAFFVYSTLNIVIHSGMIFPHRAFFVVNLLTKKHHEHHFGDFGRNYASISPLPDLLFGTLTKSRELTRASGS